MHEYRLRRVIRVVDGDTIDCTISLGFGLEASFRFRLLGIDTPEIYGPNASERGHEAAAFVEEWLGSREEEVVRVRTARSTDTTVGIGDGAFGRWLADFIDESHRSLVMALTEACYDQ